MYEEIISLIEKNIARLESKEEQIFIEYNRGNKTW